LKAEHQLLLRGDDVISMGDNINSIKKTSLFSYEKIGLELNDEKSKRIYKSRQIMLVKTAK
jgi:hypothetical protein